MTTTRIGTFRADAMSLAHVTIHFKYLDAEQVRRVFHLQIAKYTSSRLANYIARTLDSSEDMDILGDLNGHQIAHTVRQAVRLARLEERDLQRSDINRALRTHRHLSDYVKAVHGTGAGEVAQVNNRRYKPNRDGPRPRAASESSGSVSRTSSSGSGRKLGHRPAEPGEE